MKEIFNRITNDISGLSVAIVASHKNPLFIFREVFYVILSLILILFLTSLGRKILKHFFSQLQFHSPSRSPSTLRPSTSPRTVWGRTSLRASEGQVGHLEGGEIKEELLFSLGLGIIFWGSLVLVLGMLGILYFWVVWGVFLILTVVCISEAVWVMRVMGVMRVMRGMGEKEKMEKVLIFFLLAFVFLNLIGALTPEKGVDAIGYHLYFPKVYLQEHTMMLSARGSRLFSLFPHLASMIYLLPVSLNLPNVAQLFHFWLGIFSAINVALIVKKKHKEGGILASLLFYSTLVVGSISRSAYSDFFVTFFLSLGILGWVKVIGEDEGKWGKWGIITGLIFGGALATKNQSLALLPLVFLSSLITSSEDFRTRLVKLFRLFLISLSVPFLWYLRSFLVAGSPFYPMFVLRQARIPELSISFINVINVIKTSGLIQPILILIILGFFILRKEKRIVFSLIISLLIYFYWLFLPASFHDNRYFLPYLLLVIIVIHPVVKELFKRSFFKLGVLGVLGVLFIPRFYTNSLYLPYLFGFEDKKVFLSQALRERTEDFYDIDKKFSEVIKVGVREMRNMGEMREKKILIDNVLGLYYVDFPFTEFEFSPFYDIKIAESEFKKIWSKNNYGFLLLKNETLADFFGKMGISADGSSLFRLAESHQLSRTYLYEPRF